MRRYDLLALDLDGTLLNRAGAVSPRNRDAVRRARDAGLHVTICTGRGLAECDHILSQVEQHEPVVVAGGSMIACPRTRRTHHRFGIERDIAEKAVDRVLAFDFPALVLKDPLEAGYDYLVVTGPGDLALDPVTRWWFESMNVRVRRSRTLADDEHPEHTVRVGACGKARHMARVKDDLHTHCPDRAIVHHFPAVVAPDHARLTDEGDVLHVLEMFHPDANKWSAVSRIAAALGVPAHRVAAVGDEINDVSMVAGAGLGVAMGNAVPAVAAVAGRTTASNDEDGVAHAIDRILAGEW